MFYRGKYPDGGDEHELGYKRQRLIDHPPSLYGASPGSTFMYNASPPPQHPHSYPHPHPHPHPPPYAHIAQPPPFPVVRMRGLPFDCAEADIIDFFHGLDIVDILLVHKGERFSGEAFCVLGYPLQVDFALQRNKQNMGRRYIEVFRSKRQEYYKAIANEVSEVQGRSPPRRSIRRAKSIDESKDSAVHTGVLRLRGLPYSAGKNDLLDFFKDFVLSEDAVHIVLNSDGRASGEAFVEFPSADDSKEAMVKDRMTLGSRYIELFPSSREELDESVSRRR